LAVHYSVHIPHFHVDENTRRQRSRADVGTVFIVQSFGTHLYGVRMGGSQNIPNRHINVRKKNILQGTLEVVEV